MIQFLKRFNPFYFPPVHWAEKKYITLNTFKGYQMFDFHFWSPRKREYSVGGWAGGMKTSEKTIMMIGVTFLYFRMELFFDWGHKGPSWIK